MYRGHDAGGGIETVETVDRESVYTTVRTDLEATFQRPAARQGSQLHKALLTGIENEEDGPGTRTGRPA